MTSTPPNWISYGIAALVMALVLYFRGRKIIAQRPLKLATLWIVPFLFLLITASTLIQFPPSGQDWLWLAGALLIGIGFGWQRGRMMDIWVDTDSGQLMARGSRWALYFLVILVVLRMGLRGTLDMEAGSGGISPALVNDGFVFFALGLFATQRAEMAWRGLRLARRHRGTDEAAS